MNFMRRSVAPAFILAIGAFTFSCNQAELDKMKSQQDALNSEINSLKLEAAQKDSTISDFFSSFNEIEANLATIKEKEKGIEDQNLRGEVKADVKEKIIADIQVINTLMEENKRKLAGLQSKLKNANINVKQMQDMVTSLQRQIEQQEVDINDLKTQLANANAALASLNDLYNQSVAESTAKEDQLNTAYYVVGTYKELRDKNVLTKEGGVIGIGKTTQLKPEFNREIFERVDIRQTSRINTYATEVKIITTHPSSSYEIVSENNAKVINILDPRTFWASDKYLVVEQVKK